MGRKFRQSYEKLHVSRYFFISVFFVVVLLIVIPVITVYLLVGAYDEQIRNETRMTSESIQLTVRSFVDGAYNLSYELSLNENILNVNEEGISPILESAVKRNNFLELLYITDSAPGSEDFGWQVARSSGTLGDRSGRWWFLQITETKKPFVGRSYISIATGMPCTAIFIPMLDDSGEMTYVFGADISLTYLQALVDQFANQGKGNFSFIIDGEGVVIAHPDSLYLETLTNYKTLTRTVPVIDNDGNKLYNEDGSVVTKEEGLSTSESFRAAITSVIDGNSGLDIVDVYDKTYYMSYKSIYLPGYSDSWSVVTMQDRDVAMSVIYTLTTQIAIIVLLIIIVLSILIAGFFRILHRTMNFLQKARSDAENANKSKSAFLATMSHEIRTPLNAILGMTSIAETTTDIKRKDSAIERAKDASTHLLGVINNILEISKIEAGKFDLSPVSFDFEKMLTKVINVISYRVDESKQQLILNIDNDISGAFIGDEQRLSQVLINILSNATKFTPKDGIINLTAELLSENNGICHLQISVKDTGIGITDEQKQRLFTPFEQAQSGMARKFGGTGLGLAISKHIVEMMGGDIAIESEHGKGSKFIVTITLERDSKTRNEFELLIDNKDSDDEQSDDFRGFTVLLVEDIEINREIVISMLEPTGLNIDQAENGAVAVQMFKEAPDKYDMIFMDIMMPEMDGYEATAAIRALPFPNTKTIPIIAMTANVFNEDIEKCLASGMNSHLGKPLDFSEVFHRLRMYLQK